MTQDTPLTPDDKTRLDGFLAEIEHYAKTLMGYPCNQDFDYTEQQGNAAMQVGMMAMQGGVPFPMIQKMLAHSYDGSTVSRIMGQLEKMMAEDPQARQQMQMQQDAQLQQAMQGGKGGGQ